MTEYGDNVFFSPNFAHLVAKDCQVVYKRVWCCHLANSFEIYGND